MIESPQPGFTGVVWEAREAGRLARELTTGPGPVPMAEAGASWSRLSLAFGAAVVEYQQILATLQNAWQSQGSNAVHERISKLRDWLADAAAQAANNATRAASQAATYEIARMAMPNTADIAILEVVQRSLEQIGTALGAPIKAVAATTETDADVAKAAASRVMRTYEAATEPLAEPWTQAPPPALTSGIALAAEQAAAQTVATPTMSLGALPAMPNFTPPTFTMPPVQTVYRAPSVVQTRTTTEALVTQSTPVTTASASSSPIASPMAAGGPVGGTAAEHRSGLVKETTTGRDELGVDTGIVSAPAVLGGVAAPAPPVEPGATGTGAP
ncbi:PPE domain-containing protein [Nocardia sp. NPDC005998]|uniref:PPE domain-containing protein n=1 Tax=Nocardia sp. NPDC005998 TaxID=3156894 RepID=UPI0033B857D9